MFCSFRTDNPSNTMDDLKLVDALLKSTQADTFKEAVVTKFLIRIAEKDFEKE